MAAVNGIIRILDYERKITCSAKWGHNLINIDLTLTAVGLRKIAPNPPLFPTNASRSNFAALRPSLVGL